MQKISSKFPGAYILLADDYVINQELAKEMLEMMDCKVDIAEDGCEAFEMFSKNTYDLVFMDVQMPNMDGYDTTKKIRETEQKNPKHIPVIAMTANALAGDREKCLAAGMDDYIAKPIKGENLETVLKKFLPHKHA